MNCILKNQIEVNVVLCMEGLRTLKNGKNQRRSGCRENGCISLRWIVNYGSNNTHSHHSVPDVKLTLHVMESSPSPIGWKFILSFFVKNFY